ncbi:hypothetical protein MHTCC0001_08750 [Flavobacteriaceae bacterium MHTCC 0001]
MKTLTNKISILSNLPCRIFGHNYKVTKNVTSHVKEYTCTRCNKQLTTSSNGNLVELTPKFKDINNSLERLYQSKINRTKNKTVISSIY